MKKINTMALTENATRVYLGTDMRDMARKILFDELEKSGWQWAIFNEDEPDRNNGMIECILDAMEKFKKLRKHTQL